MTICFHPFYNVHQFVREDIVLWNRFYISVLAVLVYSIQNLTFMALKCESKSDGRDTVAVYS